MTKPLPQTALTPLTANTTTQENLAMKNGTQTLSNKELADQICDLIDLNTSIHNSLKAGEMTPHEGKAIVNVGNNGNIAVFPLTQR